MTSAASFNLPAAPTYAKLHFVLGRWGLASLFILGGINKVAEPEHALAMMRDVGMPLPTLLIWGVIAVEFGLGLVVAIGRRWVVPAALALIAHTVVVNLLFHDFWTMEGERARLELSLFFKNIAVIGGLFMIAGLYASRTKVWRIE